eukprot:jgi/Botrbrau1/704/Bobra.160_2s0027.1
MTMRFRHQVLCIGAALGVGTWVWYIWDSWSRRHSRKHRGSHKISTEFDTFIKGSSIANRKQPTSFDSFIRSKETPAIPEVIDNQQVLTHVTHRPRPDQAVVTVLYGTEYGFSQEIAEKLLWQLQEIDFLWPRVVNMASHPGGLPLEKEQVVLVVCSTQGDGVPPSEARDFCDWLCGSTAPQLPDLVYSVCALGDRSYVHFCACGKMLDERFDALGAKRCVPTVLVNREDWKAIDSWLLEVCTCLSRLRLKPVSELGGYEEQTGEEASDNASISKRRPFMAKVVSLEQLCYVASEADKDTVAITFDIGESGLTYTPGDALGIYPTNDPEDVEDLVRALSATGEEEVPTPSGHYSQQPSMRLREALLQCYDLRTPRPALLQLVQAHSRRLPASKGGDPNTMTNGSLANGHHPSAKGSESDLPGPAGETPSRHQVPVLPNLEDQAAVDAYLEPRHIIDILHDFQPVSLPLLEVLKGLKPLIPRLYSISSSLRASPRHVEATIAAVRYTSLDRQRKGVASTFVADRIHVGDAVPVYVSRNPDFRLPKNGSTPIIMVGPGTGLAPFKAFMQERISEAEATGQPLARSVLFFGCRREDQDFIHGQLLLAWAASGHLQLFTAFSRQQKKVYVQDRMLEAASLIWQLLEEGAHFYVCGDASQMAGAVEDALLQIISENLDGDLEKADAYLDGLRTNHRYQRDVWY